MLTLLEGAAVAGSTLLVYFAAKPEVAKSRSGVAYIKGPHAKEFMRVVNSDIDKFIAWLKMQPSLLSDPRWRRLVNRYKTKMQPMAEGEGGAAYTRNKSDVRLCVPESLKEREVSTAVFVALHELAHVANVSWGHDKSFWDTFRDLLKLAVKAGIYKKRDYHSDPTTYCGQDIASQPLDWKVV
jgi:hypothetical protein